MKIVFASGNPKKANEIQRMAPESIEVVCLKDIPQAVNVPQAEENGSTFMQNALIKAKYWAEKLNMAVLAEDSGIMIDALDGYPGVKTKRCVEELSPGSNVDADKPDELYPLLLELIAKKENADTTACWVTAMVLIDGEEKICAMEVLQGDMCPCAGDRVFGFDQYFRPKGMTETLSQMDPKEKDKIGPRKKALEKIIAEIS